MKANENAKLLVLHLVVPLKALGSKKIECIVLVLVVSIYKNPGMAKRDFNLALGL
jgi:hypothetical protein